MEQNSISGFNSAQESFQNSGEGTKVKPCNNEIGHYPSKIGQKVKNNWKIKTYSKLQDSLGPFFEIKTVSGLPLAIIILLINIWILKWPTCNIQFRTDF